MANELNGNSYYVNATGTLESPRTLVGVLLQGSGGVALLELDTASPGTDPIKMSLTAPSGETVLFDFSYCPVFFPNGVVVRTATNVKATLIFKNQGA